MKAKKLRWVRRPVNKFGKAVGQPAGAEGFLGKESIGAIYTRFDQGEWRFGWDVTFLDGQRGHDFGLASVNDAKDAAQAYVDSILRA